MENHSTSLSHFVLNRPIEGPFQENLSQIYLGMGCFWGAERKFWLLPNIHVTAVGYGGGDTPHPSYEEVCKGQTGHIELVLVVYDNKQDMLEKILKIFWENHDPTQGMRQGNDVGEQYRSAIFCQDKNQFLTAEKTRKAYQSSLSEKGFGPITTHIAMAKNFYYAEEYHQQYLAKNPNGYCGLGGTGIACHV
jgi:peptide-methionine (S)-S-oxide reductase